MHIVLVHQDLFFRGGQYVTAALARGFSAAGHRVDVVVSREHEAIQARCPDARPFELAADVGFHVLPSRRAIGNVLALARVLRRLKPDVIVPCVGHYNECVALARIVGRIPSSVVYVEHCPVGGRPARSTFRFRFDRWILQRQVSRVVAVSNGVKRELLAKYDLPDEKVTRVYNPVFDEKPSGDVVAEHVHASLRDKGVYRIVSAGGLNAGKDFKTLIEAFARFRELTRGQAKESRLVIFGEGLLRDELEAQIRRLGLDGKVVLAGYTKYLMDNFRSADAFAFSSRYETFGNVLIEALAAGLPVVSTDCPVGPREVLQDGRFGQLVPVGDIQAMAEAMARNFQGARHSMERFVVDDYVTANVIKYYLKVINEVI